MHGCIGHFRRRMECLALCSKMDECFYFKYDQDIQTCEWTSMSHDWCVPLTSPLEPLQDVYEDTNHATLRMNSGEEGTTFTVNSTSWMYSLIC